MNAITIMFLVFGGYMLGIVLAHAIRWVLDLVWP